MADKTLLPPLTQEVAQSYLKRINEDVVVELRVKEIANKIDELVKKVFRVSDEVKFTYTCFFMDKKLAFKLRDILGVDVFLPELPESCLWDETDLHINLNLMQSDLEENYSKIKKEREKAVKPPSLWDKIKSWF